MKTKTFDCVQMKRLGAKKVMEETEGMTLEEELAYWRKHTERLRKRQETAQKKTKPPR